VKEEKAKSSANNNLGIAVIPITGACKLSLLI
jgi:hypothetical protein